MLGKCWRNLIFSSSFKFSSLDTNYFFSIDDPSELLAILNSKLVTWWINTEDTQLGNGGAWRHYKYNLEKLHIPKTRNLFTKEINCILEQVSSTHYISVIDAKIYSIYHLTKEEVDYIEDRGR